MEGVGEGTVAFASIGCFIKVGGFFLDFFLLAFLGGWVATGIAPEVLLCTGELDNSTP
jgi:hypothetical protein